MMDNCLILFAAAALSIPVYTLHHMTMLYTCLAISFWFYCKDPRDRGCRPGNTSKSKRGLPFCLLLCRVMSFDGVQKCPL
jgi:hypothetical protein